MTMEPRELEAALRRAVHLLWMLQDHDWSVVGQAVEALDGADGCGSATTGEILERAEAKDPAVLVFLVRYDLVSLLYGLHKASCEAGLLRAFASLDAASDAAVLSALRPERMDSGAYKAWCEADGGGRAFWRMMAGIGDRETREEAP